MLQVFNQFAVVMDARVVGTQCYAFVRFDSPESARHVMEVRPPPSGPHTHVLPHAPSRMHSSASLRTRVAGRMDRACPGRRPPLFPRAHAVPSAAGCS